MQAVTTDEAPASIGPFSQGIRDGDTVHVSGQGPVDPSSGDVVDGDVREQTALTLDNVDAVLRAAGGSLADVVTATVYVSDMDSYDAVNEVYGERMSEPYPARSAVEVSAFPVDIDVEIEVTATVPR